MKNQEITGISYLPISDHRFKKSPFFKCNDRPDTLYGLYNNRLYPISSGKDEVSDYSQLREKCCLYDVPETPLMISGKDSIAFLNRLFTRDIGKIKIGKAGYAIACDHHGGIVMDGVLLRPNDYEYIYVQANGDFLNWANAFVGDLDVSIKDFDSWVLQVQGPTSLDVLEAVSDISVENFPYYSVAETVINGISVYVSRSGWTGERGFEIYSKNAEFDGVGLWNHLLEKGAPAGLRGSDVSSMHVRRIEAGILDYGTDLDQTLNPFEVGLKRLVHFDKADFIGRQALIDTNRKAIRLMGLKCADTSLTRGDQLLDAQGENIGFVSAGAWSPFLETGIALIRLNEAKPHDFQLRVVTASGEFDANVSDLPFYDPQKRLAR
jgi:aminomethyltransferase